MPLKTVFLIVLASVSAVYLVSLFFKQGLFQAILKGCLMPLVLAIYVFGAQRILVPVIIALVFAWAGDIFLLKISDLRRFRLGLACFLFGHVCYIIAMYNYARPLNIPVLVVSVAAAFVLGFFLFKVIRPPGEMKIPVIAYEAVIMGMAVFALQFFLVREDSFGAFVLAGSLCFVVSDTTLAFDTFHKKSRIGYFIVMLTYIAAQLCITLGFCAPEI